MSARRLPPATGTTSDEWAPPHMRFVQRSTMSRWFAHLRTAASGQRLWGTSQTCCNRTPLSLSLSPLPLALALVPAPSACPRPRPRSRPRSRPGPTPSPTRYGRLPPSLSALAAATRVLKPTPALALAPAPALGLAHCNRSATTDPTLAPPEPSLLLSPPPPPEPEPEPDLLRPTPTFALAFAHCDQRAAHPRSRSRPRPRPTCYGKPPPSPSPSPTATNALPTLALALTLALARPATADPHLRPRPRPLRPTRCPPSLSLSPPLSFSPPLPLSLPLPPSPSPSPSPAATDPLGSTPTLALARQRGGVANVLPYTAPVPCRAGTARVLRGSPAMAATLAYKTPTDQPNMHRERPATCGQHWIWVVVWAQALTLLCSFVIFASFIVLCVVFFAVWIYAVVRGCRPGAQWEKPPAYVLLPSTGHDAELEFDFAEEGAGDVKACHVQGLAFYDRS
ncbi:hypothetical protein B0H14DRAFT_3900760 [Mycena olivaceomarginata]|nr:hypothetical protein B0H14DRAFT_3900760 [Mycena olivaceomarginata]